MKNLFDATAATEVKTRLEKLRPQTERLWGKMTAAQMLAHCSVSMQWAVGEVVPDKIALPARLVGRLVKPMVFRNDDPMRKNSPTAKSLIVAGPYPSAVEKMAATGRGWGRAPLIMSHSMMAPSPRRAGEATRVTRSTKFGARRPVKAIVT
jgi:hypothetical protein